MEEKVFPKPAVAGILESSYVEARLHADGQKNIEQIRELQHELAKSVATPIYVVVDPVTQEPLGHFEGVALKEESFRDFLLEARAKDRPKQARVGLVE